MNTNVTLLVFTDLDGTLTDHDTYRWDAAQQALTALGVISSGVVLASSKTAAEVSVLRTELGLDQWPAIVENGAGVLPPYVMQVPDGLDYTRLRSALMDLPSDLQGLFRGFGDVTVTDVMQMTGLGCEAAQRAKQRAFSEPGEWRGTVGQKAEFLKHLSAQGITAQQGGRFLTLSFGAKKADQMRAIIEAYHPRHTIALGDAPNDLEMLESADFGVIIANPQRAALAPLSGEATGRIMRTKDAGPSGWNSAILDLIERLELKKD